MVLDKETLSLLIFFFATGMVVSLYFYRKRNTILNLLDFIMFGSLPNTVIFSFGLIVLGSEGDILKGTKINLAILGTLGLISLTKLLLVIESRAVFRDWVLSEAMTINRNGLIRIILSLGKTILLFSIFIPSIYFALNASSNPVSRIFAVLTIIGHSVIFKRCW